MTYIKECKVPDLSDLFVPSMNSTTAIWFFTDQGPREKVTLSLVTSYIMVVNKIIREYNIAREKLIAYINSSNETALFIESLGYFENCLISSRRAFKLIDRMNKHKYAPEIDRIIKRFLNSNASEITDIRDNIVHIDEKILDGIDDDGAHSLITTRDGECLEIADSRIRFTTLSSILKKFNDICIVVANHIYNN